MTSTAPADAFTDSALVSVSWLASRLGRPGLVILDASVPPVVPGFTSVNSGQQFAAIPGARRFDYDREVCRPDSSFPHMMPGADLFQKQARKIGIHSNSLIVVYDDAGIYASPRAWWMFKAMGHDSVLVLDGGLPAWMEENQEVADEYAADTGDGDFVACEDKGLFCDAATVLAGLQDPGTRVVDARSEGRFRGHEPEPRPGVRGGHMPNAENLPFGQVLEQGRVKPASVLRTMFRELATEDEHLITSCGSGITACVLTLAAWEAGYRNLSVYDGSWAEWGSPSHLPVVTG